MVTEKVAVNPAVLVVSHPWTGGLPHGVMTAPGMTKMGSLALLDGAVPV